MGYDSAIYKPSSHFKFHKHSFLTSSNGTQNCYWCSPRQWVTECKSLKMCFPKEYYYRQFTKAKVALIIKTAVIVEQFDFFQPNIQTQWILEYYFIELKLCLAACTQGPQFQAPAQNIQFSCFNLYIYMPMDLDYNPIKMVAENNCNSKSHGIAFTSNPIFCNQTYPKTTSLKHTT